MNAFVPKIRRGIITISIVVFFACFPGCRQHTAPDVEARVQQSLEQAGFRAIHVSQDREKGVVTLTGTLATDNDKIQAESVARSAAAGQVVANQISVRPPGEGDVAKHVQSDMDQSIDKAVDATLVQHHLDHDVSYKVKEGVVTLTGNVHSQSQRTQVEKLVAATPSVQQVVNELQVKDQKATSSSAH